MSLNFSALVKHLFRRFTKKTPSPALKRFRPMLEACEDRTNPTPVVTVAALADASESSMLGVSARLTRTETSGTLVVNFSLSGTAGADVDYYSSTVATFLDGNATTDIAFMPINDSTSEATETIVLTLTSGTGYTVGSPSSATLNLLDNDTQVVTVAALADAAEGGSNGTLRFTRLGDLSAALTANISVSGTATSGTDYTSIGTTVTFAANAATADKTVAALDDVTYDPGETVVATVTTGTGYTVGSPSAATAYITDDEGTPVYWVGGNGASWSTAANWSNNAVPTSSTAVYFSSSYSNYGVTTPSADIQLGELHFVGNYSGTVTLDGDLTVGKLELASAGATLDQPSGATSGSDVTVTAAMVWTGGTLNSTNHLAELILTGTDTWGTFAPTSGGTVNLGSSISLANGAVGTIKEGTVDLNKDGVEISTSTGSSLLIAPDGVGSAILGVTQYLQGEIGPGTTWTVSAEDTLQFRGQVINSGGTFTLLRGSTAEITGTAFSPFTDNVAYTQVGATAATFLHGNSVLVTPDRSVAIDTGILATVYDADASTANATIRTKLLTVRGGDIYIDYQGANSHFAELVVDGNVKWINGTFHVFVYCDGMTSDVWRTTNQSGYGGRFDIDGGTGAPIFVDSDYGTASTPSSGTDWEILVAGGGLVDETGPAVSSPTIWEMEIDPATPAVYWTLIVI